MAKDMLERWILQDEDGDYDDELGLFDAPITERLSHRTDRGAGWRHVQQLMYESDQQCYDILRMNQRTFEALCKMLGERYGLKETHHVYLEESVAMFLETVGQDKTKRDIAARYQRSVDTVQRKLDEVLSALLKFAEDTLRPQEGEFGRVSPVLRNDDRYWPHFRDCIGALDGTHVPVRPPSQNAEAYRGRKQDPTMNVLAICNFDMKFIYAYVGVPGRAHDTKVLTHCARNEASFPHPPPGKYYLVDSGYPTRTGYLGPHRNMRYHLGQFATGGPPVSARELFNRKHSGLRSVIERTFGVWKAKWRILDRKHPKYGLVKWIKLVTATMALHNFIRDSHREDHDFVQWQSGDGGEGEEADSDGDEEEEEEEEEEDDDDDGGGGGHIVYEPTGDKAMEALRDNITNEYGRGRLPF
ncbi:protein ANTAGONIST OF LIKE HETEROCHROMATIN PROTEIN 1 isoform X1 [Brassica napus]|uniref:protein ANTAGONIST OF LIKE HETEROCHROMATIN PROTEIN 1 isoform X1 n=1 Tax=Brassica napus TaxID=3708 RepID=UPI0020793129|nr:protein ANTAGONIST OF LIKE HETEROCHROMATIN PROTEIN 1 isoform X1 [Brassica napus]